MILTVFFLSLLAADPTIVDLWPAEVRQPANLKPYSRTNHVQRSVVRNSIPTIDIYRLNQNDDLFGRNPNQDFPYRVPGGLDLAEGWKSYLGISIPKGKRVYTWHVRPDQVSLRPFRFWEFPVGTEVFDLLVNEGSSRPFELRRLRREETNWKANVLWQADALPRGYQRTDRRCVDCHRDAGDATRYGLAVRGNDFIFSWSPFKEGTQELDYVSWPLRDY